MFPDTIDGSLTIERLSAGSAAGGQTCDFVSWVWLRASVIICDGSAVAGSTDSGHHP